MRARSLIVPWISPPFTVVTLTVVQGAFLPSVKVFALTIRAVFAPIFLYKDGRKMQNVEKFLKQRKNTSNASVKS